ncbi:DnaJ subfamily A member 2 [Tritrichomonas foetus]|uniref:DnaJ subfamily A member 2 n=1 Tax=Tritrichomonas foetus TaxID=1144522 RepID=A0A1J4J257_9EUKA|nr:DnaJ subfamily A member 2 [Tritrichomonas foetus]|eukprot:OHS93458.1 DnaJ subfamily A member 2 [Tritrichomonas foetus]
MISDSYLYDALGVDVNASPKELKRAYLKKSAKINENSDNNIAKLLDTAFHVLIDPNLRHIYDQHGLVVLDEIEESDYLNRSYYSESKVRTPRKQHRTIQTFDLKLSLKDLYNGCTVPLGVEIEQQCRKCKGSGIASPIKCKCKTCNGGGRVYISSDPYGTGKMSPRKCPDCYGKGVVLQKKKGACRECLGYGIEKIKANIDATIPPGTADGDRVSVDGYDDIKIAIIEKRSSRFVREGNDLYVRKIISLTQAICGVRFPIKHLDGRILICNSEPSQIIKPGTTLVIENEGFPILETPSKKGNLYVVFDIEFPQSQDIDQRLNQLIGHTIPQQKFHEIDDVVVLKDSSIEEFGKSYQKKMKMNQVYSDYYSDDEYFEEDDFDFDGYE